MAARAAAALTPALSVVVLCYRAGESARDCVAGIRAALLAAGIVDHQLVLVGNYFPDRGDTTPQVVRALAAEDPRVLCSAVPKQGMMGWDMRTGLALATGECVAIVDGDGQVLVEDLIRVYRKLREEDLELAMTCRTRRGDGLRRKMLSFGFNGLVHLLFPGIRARDVNAKPKILTRAALERLTLRSDDWFIDAEVMIQARRHGLRVGEVETRFLGLTGRRSFVSIGAVVEFAWNLARYRLREPLRRGRP